MALGNAWGNPKRKKGNRLLTKLTGVSSCVVCGVTKTRKWRKNGEETPYNLLRRKTCGNYWDGNRYTKTNCSKEYITGKGNPHYKGYMPKCKICGKRISYNSAKDNKKGELPQYCGKHWLIKMKKDKKGHCPNWLKPHAFQKGVSHLHLHKEDCGCFVCCKNYGHNR